MKWSFVIDIFVRLQTMKGDSFRQSVLSRGNLSWDAYTVDGISIDDLDEESFRIFRRLRENIAINAIPYMMDRNTLISNIGKAQKADDSYLKELEKLLEDNAFSIFHETIKTMIEYRVRLLEQENLI